MGKKTNVSGLIALGLAAAAYWKWGMKQDQKDQITAKVKDTANNLKNKANGLRDRLPEEIKSRMQ